MKGDDLLVVFPTTHLTLKAEKVLKGAGISHRTILKPRKISSDCGLAIQLRPGDMGRAAAAFEGADDIPAAFYRSEEDQYCEVVRDEGGRKKEEGGR